MGRRTAYVLCMLAIFGYESYALFVQEGGATSHIPRAQDLHLTREINATTSLAQSFVMHAEGFRGIELFPRASTQPAAGPLHVTILRQISAESAPVQWEPVHKATIDVGSLDLTRSVVVSIPRIDQTAGAAFRVEIAMAQAPPGHGLRFEAGGPTYVQGAMEINGRREWGDLKFRTLAQRTTVFRNVQRLRQSLPPLLQTDLFWITMLVAINWAIATVVYYLGFAPEREPQMGK